MYPCFGVKEVPMAEPAYRHDHDHLPTRKDGRAWPAPGHWTYEDYRRLPDDGQRYEVIRGTLYVTGAPDYDHQYAVHQLHRLLGNPVAEQGLGVILGAPFEVLLPRGTASPVQPDILFFRTGNEPRPGAPRFEGVPDLIVEALSPGTRRRDEGIKLETYEEAEVPEYWLVDPRGRLVRVLVLTGGRYAELGRFVEGEMVRSVVLPELRLRVADLFPSPRSQR
jgi:Uma2 family endonuclease